MKEKDWFVKSDGLFDAEWFYTTKFKELEPIYEEALEQVAKANTFKNENGYVIATRAKNPELFDTIERLGFFMFQALNTGDFNNKKQVVGIHQLVMYCTKGWLKLRFKASVLRDAEPVEIHHYNSRTDDNNPENLTYVTAQQNSLCANAVHKPYHGLRFLTSANIQHWFDWGGGASDTAALIRKTIVCTMLGAGFTLKQIPAVANILLQLPVMVGKELFKHWQFRI